MNCLQTVAQRALIRTCALRSYEGIFGCSVLTILLVVLNFIPGHKGGTSLQSQLLQLVGVAVQDRLVNSWDGLHQIFNSREPHAFSSIKAVLQLAVPLGLLMIANTVSVGCFQWSQIACVKVGFQRSC